MYKPITNCPSEDNPGKSQICSQVEAGNISPDQLYCCWSGNCSVATNNLTDCVQPKELAQCRNLTNFDACHRTDELARRVCDWQDGLFCLSTKGISTGPDYTHFPEGIAWMLSRRTVGESYNGTAAYYDDNSKTYQLCSSTSNSTNCDWNSNCTDLFQDGCGECAWRNGTFVPGNPRRIKGELCETIPTKIVDAPTAIKATVGSNSPLVIGLSTSTGLLGLCLINYWWSIFLSSVN